MKNLWQGLRKNNQPFLVQAPMDDVTDVVFRSILEHVGRPDVFFTEFASTDGLCSKGKERVMEKLRFTQGQRPIVAQVWGNDIHHYKEVAKLVKQLGFDGIDINMGCPVRKVVGRGQCSGLIKNPKLAGQLIQSIREAAPDIPLSVKTRIGFGTIQTEEWIGFLLEQNLDALTIHGRIATRLSKDPANWEEIGKAVRLRDQMEKPTPIIGNGDVLSYQEAIDKSKQYGVDGVMIGRGLFQNLWIFDNRGIKPEDIPTKEKLQLLIDHITLFEKIFGGPKGQRKKSVDLMRKFYKVYIHGMPNAAEFRNELMQLRSPQETIEFLRKFIVNSS